MRVLKYPLGMPDADNRTTVQLPPGAAILSVGLQDDQMMVWALANFGEKPLRPREFVIVNTGRDFATLPINARFLGTVTTSNGIVWHVWVQGK